jgi:hypothetical protein
MYSSSMVYGIIKSILSVGTATSSVALVGAAVAGSTYPTINVFDASLLVSKGCRNVVVVPV